MVLSWIPIFVLCNIVDRNPVSADDVRRKINLYLSEVRNALLDPSTRADLAARIEVSSQYYIWNDIVSGEPRLKGDVFEEFNGQGRFHWHHAVAGPILAGIEVHVASVGRSWLTDDLQTWRALLLEMAPQGIFWHDSRKWWRAAEAMIVVLGTAAGAFWLRFWTPTVGLGCHSGGYMIFVILSCFNFVAEMILWHVLSSVEKVRFKKVAEALLILCETANTVWLLYITLAATFGFYETCSCLAGTWDPLGGYIDLADLNGEEIISVLPFWISGTIASLLVLSWATILVVWEWCEQSHLTTLSYDEAARGLLLTRRWRRAFQVARRIPQHLLRAIRHLWTKLTGRQIVDDIIWSRKSSSQSEDLSEKECDSFELHLLQAFAREDQV